MRAAWAAVGVVVAMSSGGLVSAPAQAAAPPLSCDGGTFSAFLDYLHDPPLEADGLVRPHLSCSPSPDGPDYYAVLTAAAPLATPGESAPAWSAALVAQPTDPPSTALEVTFDGHGGHQEYLLTFTEYATADDQPTGVTAQATWDMTLTTASDVGVTGLDHVGSTTRGEVGTYRVMVDDLGPDPAVDTTVRLQLDPAATLVSAPPECTMDSATAPELRCRLPQLATGAPLALGFGVRNPPAPAGGDVVVVVASPFADETETTQTLPDHASLAVALTAPTSAPAAPTAPAISGPGKLPGVVHVTKAGQVTLAGEQVHCDGGGPACTVQVVLRRKVKGTWVQVATGSQTLAAATTTPVTARMSRGRARAIRELARPAHLRAAITASRSGAASSTATVRFRLWH